MTEAWSFEDSIYESIRSYVTVDWSYDIDHTLYVLDNMLLTKLATVARQCPDEFKVMLDIFAEEKAVFFIPDIIFEESAQSKHTTPEQYAIWYEVFFNQVHQICKVVRVDFQAVYDIMAEGATSLEKAFITFKLIATETVRMNPDLLDRVDDAKNIRSIQEAIYSVRKDCGERVIHLLVCALLSNGGNPVTVLSNEEVGVFKARQIFARNESLLNLLYMENKYVFLESYCLYSFELLLYNTLLGLEKGIILEFLQKVRNQQDQSRYVRMIFGDESDRTQIDNIHFTDLIVDEKAKLTF